MVGCRLISDTLPFWAKTTKVMSEKKEIKLSNGSVAVIGEFKGRQVLEAQKTVGKETEKMLFALMAQCVTIDGKRKVMEDYEDMPGGDVLKLMGEFGENFQ